MYYNVIPVLGSQIIKEKPLHGSISYVNKVYISNSLSIILGDYNPHMFESDGTIVPVGDFANPQVFYPNKTYYVILADVDDLKDGFDHYIQYIGRYTGDMKPGVYCDDHTPLHGDKNEKKTVNGFRGLIIGSCVRKEAVLSYSGIGCPQFYYSDFLGVKCDDVLYLETSDGINIPINPTDEERWKISRNLEGLHIFSCRFGYQGMNGENIDYPHLNNCLYVSGIILDVDPNTLDLPSEKTYFDNID